MKNPKVSIVIVNYNEQEHSLECLKSLEKIEYKNFNVFIVDNKSYEKDKLKSYCKNNKKAKLIENEENEGFTGGNNKGIKEAMKSEKTEYVLMLNNDTTVKKDFLKKLVDFAEKNEDAGVISPQINKYSDKNKINKQNLSGKFNLWLGGGKPIQPKNEPYETKYNSGCCWLIKREVLEMTEGFNEKYFAYKEEIEWAYRIGKQGYKFYVLPHSIIYHKGEQTNKKLTGFRQYHEIKNSLFFVREYGNFLQKIFFICYALSYKILKQFFLNFKSIDTPTKNKMFFKGIKEGLFSSYH